MGVCSYCGGSVYYSQTERIDSTLPLCRCNVSSVERKQLDYLSKIEKDLYLIKMHLGLEPKVEQA